MKLNFIIILISISWLFLSCKEKSLQLQKTKKVVPSKITEKPKNSQNSKKYFYTISNRLSLRKNPSLNAKKITVLKYLEPMEIIEDLLIKKETIKDKEDGIVKGNWCKVRLLNGTEGYAFNGYIKQFEELSKKLNPKGIEPNELLVNGNLKTTTTLKHFLEIIEKPDSIMSYNLVKEEGFSDIEQREYKNGILYITQNTNGYIDTDSGDFLDAGYGGWIYNNIKMKYYYKNGIEYEELDGEVGFSNIDFTQNNNYLEYNGFRIDSTTTFQTITKLFPIQSINNQRQYDDGNNEILYEFGSIREKNNSNEVGWQLLCSKKATNFRVYWYD